MAPNLALGADQATVFLCHRFGVTRYSGTDSSLAGHGIEIGNRTSQQVHAHGN
jgi:hypothetical protein